MDYNSIRVTALDFARNLQQVRDPTALIIAADMIEGYIRAGNTIPKTSGKLDFDAAYRETLDTNEYNWSGYAAELIKACNSGNVIALTSRNCGMSRLMSEYFAHQTTQHGKSVLWLTNNASQCKDIERLLETVGADLTRIMVSTYRNIATRARGRGFDFVYAEEMASLSYSEDDHFMATVLPMGKRFIFSSTPNQTKGLFFDLWENSLSFYKFRITWDMPLMEVTRQRIARKEELAGQMEPKLFKSSYMGEFIPEEKNVANTPAYQYWTGNTAATPAGPVHLGGGYVHWTSAATPPPPQGWTTCYTETGTTGAATSPATMNGNLSFEPVDPKTYESMVQKLSDEPVKRTKKPRRKKGASFNDEDYTDPVG